MTGKPDVMITIDLAKIQVPTEPGLTLFRAGYGRKIVAYIVEETESEGTLMAAIVIEDGGQIEVKVNP